MPATLASRAGKKGAYMQQLTHDMREMTAAGRKKHLDNLFAKADAAWRARHPGEEMREEERNRLYVLALKAWSESMNLRRRQTIEKNRKATLKRLEKRTVAAAEDWPPVDPDAAP